MGEIQQLFKHLIKTFDEFLSQAQAVKRIEKYVLEVVVSGQAVNTPLTPDQHTLLCTALTTLLHTLQEVVDFCSEGLRCNHSSRNDSSPPHSVDSVSTQAVYSDEHHSQSLQQQQHSFGVLEVRPGNSLANREEEECSKIAQTHNHSPTTKETEAANVLMNLSGKAGDRLSQGGPDTGALHLSQSPHHVLHLSQRDMATSKDPKFISYLCPDNSSVALMHLTPDVTLKPVIYSCPDEVPQINEKDLLPLATQVLCQICGRQCEDLVELHEHVLAAHNPPDSALTTSDTAITNTDSEPTFTAPDPAIDSFTMSEPTLNSPTLVHNFAYRVPDPGDIFPNPIQSSPHDLQPSPKKPRLQQRNKVVGLKPPLVEDESEEALISPSQAVGKNKQQLSKRTSKKRGKIKRTNKDLSCSGIEKKSTAPIERIVNKVSDENSARTLPNASSLSSYMYSESLPISAPMAVRSDAPCSSDQAWLQCQTGGSVTELVAAGSDSFVANSEIVAASSDALAIAIESSQIKTLEVKFTIPIFVCIECSCGFTESKRLNAHSCDRGRPLIYRHPDGSITLSAHQSRTQIHTQKGPKGVWFFPEFTVEDEHDAGLVLVHSESGRTIKLHTSHDPTYLSEHLISFKCPVCGSDWDGLGKFLDHFTIGPCMFRCPECHMAYPTPAKLASHRSTLHPSLEERTCPQCQMVFEMRHQRNRHLKTKCSERHVCQECGRTVKNLYNLRLHMQSHQPRCHKCQDCGAAFHRRTVLKRHMMSHTGTKPHACPQCPARFYTRQHLRTHLDRHEGKLLFQCDSCNSTFHSEHKRDAHQAKVHAQLTHPDTTQSRSMHSLDATSVVDQVNVSDTQNAFANDT